MDAACLRHGGSFGARADDEFMVLRRQHAGQTSPGDHLRRRCARVPRALRGCCARRLSRTHDVLSESGGSVKYVVSLALIFLVALVVFALRGPTTPPARPQVSNDRGTAAIFPQQRAIPGYTLTIHAPQVREWPEFKRFTSTIAFALTPTGETVPQYGTATVAGDTSVDLDNRIVTIRSPKVTDVTFANSV